MIYLIYLSDFCKVCCCCGCVAAWLRYYSRATGRKVGERERVRQPPPLLPLPLPLLLLQLLCSTVPFLSLPFPCFPSALFPSGRPKASNLVPNCPRLSQERMCVNRKTSWRVVCCRALRAPASFARRATLQHERQAR